MIDILIAFALGEIIGLQAYDIIECAILPEAIVLRYLGLIGTI